MKITNKEKIKQYLRVAYPQFVAKGEIELYGMREWGRMGDTIARDCRKLEQEGVIEKTKDDRGHVMYRWVDSKSNNVVLELREILEKHKKENPEVNQVSLF